MYKDKNKFEDISIDTPTISTKKFSEWPYSRANPPQLKKKFQLFSFGRRETKLLPQNNVNCDSQEPANTDFIQYEPYRSQIPTTSGHFETRASILKSSKLSSSRNNQKCTRFNDNGFYVYDENYDYKNRTAKEDVDSYEINKIAKNDSSRCDFQLNKLNENESYHLTDNENYEKQTDKEDIGNVPNYIKFTENESYDPDSEYDSEINEIPRWLYKNSQKAAKFVPKNNSNCSAETNKQPIRVMNYEKYIENNENYPNIFLDYASQYHNKTFQFDPYEDYQFAERKNSINQRKNMKTIATSINSMPPINSNRNSQSSNTAQYVYNVHLEENKNTTNLTENVDRQLEELKLIRDELKSLSRSSCMSFQLGNSLEVGNHEYTDIEENFASYRPCGKCPDINCYMCTIDHEYDEILKSIGSPIFKTRIKKSKNSTKNEDDNCDVDSLLNPTNVTTRNLSMHHTPSLSKPSNSLAFTTIKSIHTKFPTNKSEAIGTSESRLCPDVGSPFNITITDDIRNELKEKKDEIGHKKCQVVKLVKQHMDKAERSSPRSSCQSCLQTPCQNVNVYITPTVPPTPSDENKEKPSDTKDVIPPRTAEVITPPPTTVVTTPLPISEVTPAIATVNTNTFDDPSRHTEWEYVEPHYRSHHARHNEPNYDPHYTRHFAPLRPDPLQKTFSSDENPTSDYPEYDDPHCNELLGSKKKQPVLPKPPDPPPIERVPSDASIYQSDLELHQHGHSYFYAALALFAIWFIFTFAIGFDGNNGMLSSICYKFTKPY